MAPGSQCSPRKGIYSWSWKGFAMRPKGSGSHSTKRSALLSTCVLTSMMHWGPSLRFKAHRTLTRSLLDPANFETGERLDPPATEINDLIRISRHCSMHVVLICWTNFFYFRKAWTYSRWLRNATSQLWPTPRNSYGPQTRVSAIWPGAHFNRLSTSVPRSPAMLWRW